MSWSSPSTSCPRYGRLYALTSQNRLLVIDSGGSVQAFSLFGAGVLAGPLLSIDFDATTGDLWGATSPGQFARVSLSGSVQARPSPTPAGPLAGLAVSHRYGDVAPATMYAIDPALDALVRVDNFRTSGGGTAVVVGPLGVDAPGDVAFDLSVDGTAWLAIPSPTGASLYTVNRTTGAATPAGVIAAAGPVSAVAAAVPGRVDIEFSGTWSEASNFRSIVFWPAGEYVRATTIRCRATDGTAVAGEDFVAIDRTVTLEPGVVGLSVDVYTLEDALDEPVEGFTLECLGVGSDAAPVWPSIFAVTIADNDDPPPPGAPRVTILDPTTGPAFAGPRGPITLAGEAHDDDGHVVEVRWVVGQNSTEQGPASGTTHWFANEVPTLFDRTVITVFATDDDGLTGRAVINVFPARQRTHYLSEGATGPFFDTDIAVLGSDAFTATFLREGASPIVRQYGFSPPQRRTITVDGIPGLENASFSTLIQGAPGSTHTVERTMRWGPPGAQYGAHTEKASGGPARRWFFAEGSQGFFSTYLLLANGDTAANQATVDWLIEGGSPVRRVYALAGQARLTVDAGGDPALVGRSFGIVVTFDWPGMAERAMYFGAPLFAGGHASAGVTGASTTWYLSEGASGSFFSTFVLLANPGPTPAVATLTFLRSNGQSVVHQETIPAQGRRTVNPATLPGLADAAFGVEILSSEPIVVERSQVPGPTRRRPGTKPTTRSG